MTPERNKLPDWARREREGDLDWIRENLDSFWPLARNIFHDVGRGVIVVDTTQQPDGGGHPFGYLTQENVEKSGEEDTIRIMNTYDPEEEFVLLMIKTKDRTSTYRVRPLVPGQDRTDNERRGSTLS